MSRATVLLAILFLATGCTRASGAAQPMAMAHVPAPGAPVAVVARPLAGEAGPCTGAFVAHDLDHVTSAPGEQVRMFEGNGTGMAIGDLDADGDLDIVLANHHGPNTILWNQGGLRFQTERLGSGDARAVSIVDVDSDGRLDIVFTRRASGLNYWRNTGQAEPGARFVPDVLPGIVKPAYAMNWGDLDGDGDLDLVAASYDASLLTDLGSAFLMESGAGVYYYEQRGARFVPTRLAGTSQALALALFDVNSDGQRDIVVGNDFAVRDQTWVRQGDRWVEAHPFATTSHSTMSLDAGDIDNDGTFELFSTDMKPYDNSVATLAIWRPFMAALWDPVPPGDPQIMENVLQVRDEGGTFHNQAYERGIDATGWSWSGKFGDLNNDGFVDLYVVNGMIEADTFRYLPNHELVEQNQALRNDGTGHFIPAPQWALGSPRSGRGMSMADLDNDGDLDIVVNNLRAPAQVFENRLCSGAGLEVDLHWPASMNTHALGATLALHTSAGSLYREVRAASGYLSGDPARVHFGFPAGSTLRQLEIRWPDGAVSAIDRPAPQTLLTVTRER